MRHAPSCALHHTLARATRPQLAAGAVSASAVSARAVSAAGAIFDAALCTRLLYEKESYVEGGFVTLYNTARVLSKHVKPDRMIDFILENAPSDRHVALFSLSSRL